MQTYQPLSLTATLSFKTRLQYKIQNKKARMELVGQYVILSLSVAHGTAYHLKLYVSSSEQW
jgi:hypothetical protein